MQATLQVIPSQQLVGGRGQRMIDLSVTFAVVVIVALVYASVFNRESTLSYSIGYNLYAAERVLDREVPYRDFHTLYPPATLYLNACLFKLFGTSLYSALVGVLFFKVATILMIYLGGRLIMPRSRALAGALFSFLWLRPNGPFKSVPMHYGALFLALALYLLLRYERRRHTAYVLLAGIALGLVALFKHNIGAYGLLGSMIVLLLDERQEGLRLRLARQNYMRCGALAAGFGVPLLPFLLYMETQGALSSMTKTLLFGPGEFLLSRLASTPSPLIPVVAALALSPFVFVARRLRSNTRAATLTWILVLALASSFLLLSSQTVLDKLIFYTPVMVVCGAFLACILGGKAGVASRVTLFSVLVFATVSLMEAFPRFAREQAIGAMPFVVLLLIYLLYKLRPLAESFTGGKLRAGLSLVILPVVLLIMAGRLIFATYFDDSFRLRSNTQLNIERGRGVYFPKAAAGEISQVAAYIQQRVPEGGYFFAQSYAGSAFLFLADRRNPSGAQFWGGVGVTPRERGSTLEAIKEKNVSLIVTSEKDLAAEKYKPMRDYIDQNFHGSQRMGDVIILERDHKTRQD